MKRAICFLLAVALAANGCATLFGSRTKGVMFTSDPTGAEVIINGQSYGRTPLSLNLKQKHDYSITFRDADHEDRTYLLNNGVGAGWIILDILGGLIPVIIDAATGAWYSLENSSVHGVLPASKIPSPTDSVRVTSSVQSQPTTISPSPADVVPGGNAIAVLPGVPVTITLENGTILAAKSVSLSGGGDLKVTLVDGRERYIGSHKVKAIMDSGGINQTSRVIDERKSLP